MGIIDRVTNRVKKFFGGPEVRSEAPRTPERPQERPQVQPRQSSVRESTLHDLQASVDASQRDTRENRLLRINEGTRRRFKSRMNSNLASPTGNGQNPDLTVEEAADYITESGGRIEARQNGTFSISLNTARLPRGNGGEENLGLMDLVPPLREFSLKIQREKPDGSPGEETFSQRVKTRVAPNGRMECFYRDQSGQDVVLDTSKLDLGHTTIETSLEFDENFSKKQVKETMRQQLNAADEQARMISETVRIPHRSRDYTPYDETSERSRKTPSFAEVEPNTPANDDSTPLPKPEELVEGIETDEPFVKGFDDFQNTVILRKTAYGAFRIAKDIAKRDGYKLKVTSSYRSFGEQEDIVNRHKRAGNYDPALVAPTGRSNHHTGGAIDIHAIDSRGRENQDALAKIMTEANFVNYEREDWHWEYGTQRWANKKRVAGVYSKVAKLDRESVPAA